MKRCLVCVLFLLVLSGCTRQPPVITEQYIAGTVVTQTIPQGNNSQAEIKDAARQVTERLRELESYFSVTISASDISRLNQSHRTTLQPDTKLLLEKALSLADTSDGAFNPCLLPLIHTWNISSALTEDAVFAVPSPSQIEQAKQHCGYHSLQVNGSEAFLSDAQGGVDLGGIAKGYMADEAVSLYRQLGIENACISLGGNIYAIGHNQYGHPWNIAIQDPRAPHGASIGTISLTDKSVVTSGDYERYVEQDGIRYHHIIDPSTGSPARSGIMSVSVISEDSAKADALSTAAFVLGLKGGRALLEKEHCDFIIVTEDKKIHLSKGIQDTFQFTGKENGYDVVS